MKFADVYPLYVQKADRKNRTKEEVDQIIRWLTGYTQAGLQRQITTGADFATFFAQAPAINPNTSLIKGVICGVRVEEIEDPLSGQIDRRAGQRKGDGKDSARISGGTLKNLSR